MTQTIVIGSTEKTVDNPIEFIYLVGGNNTIRNANLEPENYEYIELISRDYNINGEDIMFAYDNPDRRDQGIVYIGHWNSGKVE